VDDPVFEDGSSASTDVLQEGTVALEGVEDADQAILHNPRGEGPTFVAFGFSVPTVPKQGCPLLSYEVPGHPQKVVWRLRNFRSTKLPLRLIVGSRVGEQCVVDMYALMREK